MKKILFAIIVVMTSAQISAQEKMKVQTLAGGKTYNSGYIALSSDHTRFNSENAVLVGGYGGWLINHKLMIGLGGYGTVTRHTGFGNNPQDNGRNLLRMGYGGLVMEYTFAGDKLIHVIANTLIGAGAVSNGYKKDYHYGDNGEQWRSVGSSAFFVLHPSVSAEMNLGTGVRIAVGGGYRYIQGSKLEGITDQKMSALTASLSLKFGFF